MVRYTKKEVSLRYEYYAKKGRWYIYIDDFDAEEHIIDLDMYRWTWAIEEHEFREEK